MERGRGEMETEGKREQEGEREREREREREGEGAEWPVVSVELHGPGCPLVQLWTGVVRDQRFRWSLAPC